MLELRIRSVMTIDCEPDLAWRSLHDPAVAARLYAPALEMRPAAGTRLPERFRSGSRTDVALLAFGILPLGTQRIAIEDLSPTEAAPGARTMRDAGRPLTGPLALLRSWNHEISVYATRTGTAIWHEELTIGGLFAPIGYLVLAPMWRVRAMKLRGLAKGWRG